MSVVLYTDEEKRFIIANIGSMTDEEMATALGRSAQGLRTWRSKRGLTKNTNYSVEQNLWISDHVKDYRNIADMAIGFNEAFGTTVSADSLKHKVTRLVPEHKWGHGGGMTPGTGFSVTAKPIGSETWKGGYLYIKVNDTPMRGDDAMKIREENWVKKHQYIWEQIYGKVPNGHIVVFLDGNRANFNIENLYCIPRKIQTVMMRNGWWSNNPELTLAAIKWCELHFTIKEVNSND